MRIRTKDLSRLAIPSLSTLYQRSNRHLNNISSRIILHRKTATIYSKRKCRCSSKSRAGLIQIESVPSIKESSLWMTLSKPAPLLQTSRRPCSLARPKIRASRWHWVRLPAESDPARTHPASSNRWSSRRSKHCRRSRTIASLMSRVPGKTAMTTLHTF